MLPAQTESTFWNRTVLTAWPWTVVTKEDIQEHFKDASGKIQDIKLMNGFGFIEYEDPMDARDVVPGESSLS